MRNDKSGLMYKSAVRSILDGLAVLNTHSNCSEMWEFEKKLSFSEDYQIKNFIGTIISYNQNKDSFTFQQRDGIDTLLGICFKDGIGEKFKTFLEVTEVD